MGVLFLNAKQKAMKVLSSKTFLFAVLGSLVLVGCKQQRLDNDTTASENEAFIQANERAFENDIEESTRSVLVNDQCNPLNYLNDCVEVTDSGEGVYPREIILDYGDGCLGQGGRIRYGQIIINLSDDMGVEGATRTVTFQDFAVNNTYIEGTRVAISQGTNGEGQPQWTRTVDMTFTRNGNELGRNFNQDVTWLSGYNTEECGDNVFQISGSGSVTRPNGNVVTRTIISPLIVDKVCGYTVQGVIVVDAPLGQRTLDFGDGSCDDDAIVIIDGEEFPIDL